jgi:hypothetical protein
MNKISEKQRGHLKKISEAKIGTKLSEETKRILRG